VTERTLSGSVPPRFFARLALTSSSQDTPLPISTTQEPTATESDRPYPYSTSSLSPLVFPSGFRSVT